LKTSPEEDVKKLSLSHGASETAEKCSGDMCGRAIKPVRLTSGTDELSKEKFFGSGYLGRA
jgi:hypothetical protein